MTRRCAMLMLCFAIAGCCCAPIVRADGKVFSKLTAKIDIPQQQALLCWDEQTKTETLVIETAFVGRGDEFAWIVPLPSPPKVDEATTGLFPTLQVVFSPRIVEYHRHWYLLFLLLVVLAGLRITGHVRLFWTVIAATVVLAIWIALFTSALAAGRKSVASSFFANSTRVHDRLVVGAYDVAVLSADAGDDLMSWLNENDYVVDPAIASAVQQYIKDGWVFAAARLRYPGGLDSASPHPLRFTFQADRAVYPMRLTGVNNGDLSLDLFVFADQRASATNMQVARCSQPKVIDSDKRALVKRSESSLTIGHAGLKALIGDAKTATKLSGVLTPDQMKQDIYLDWSPYRAEGEWFFSKTGAGRVSLNVFACLLGGGILLLLMGRSKKRYSEKTAIRRALVLTLCCTVGGAASWMLMPKIKVQQGRHPFQNRMRHSKLASDLDGMSRTNGQKLFEPDQLALHIGSFWDHWVNPYTGRQVVMEDSPGNFMIQPYDDGYLYIYFDATGAASQHWPMGFGSPRQ